MSPHDFSGNRLIMLLTESGDFSDKGLQKAYYTLCKEAHPDSHGGSTEDFIHLSEEYEQAKEGLPWLREYFGRFKSRQESQVNIVSVRLAFYMSLRRYAVAGLYSTKVRLRSNLQARNRIILEEVVKSSSLYDKGFIPLFLQFNRNHLKKYSLWFIDRSFKNGRNYFIKGFGFFFDYQLRGTKEMYNIAHSYLTDARYELDQSLDSPARSSMLAFVNWLLLELDKESLFVLINRPQNH